MKAAIRPDRLLIRNVLSLPTAPFHEGAVMTFIKNFARRWKLPCRQDRYGNLKIVYKRGKGRRPIALTAHMDHPGFEIVRGGQKPAVRLLGGVPDQYFRGAKVLVWNRNRPGKAKVTRCLDKKKRIFQLDRTFSRGAFGTFALPACRFRGDLIHTKAADDLINVAVLLNVLKEVARRRSDAHVIFLFTRAEEVGLVGASGVVKGRWVSPNIPVIVLEASSAKAGKVQIGDGPVLRVGDKTTTFSHRIDEGLQTIARRLARRDKKFKWQRALLAGGTCESTLFVQKKYAAGGLALPLGNYHNAGAKNYAAEYISYRDYGNLLRWLAALIQDPLSGNRRRKPSRADRLFARYARRLVHQRI